MPMSPNILNAAQCRAARALVEWSAERLSRASGINLHVIRDFELRFRRPDDSALRCIRTALESAGVEFIPENGHGAGVRLRFNLHEIRAIKRWEAEGGLTSHSGLY